MNKNSVKKFLIDGFPRNEDNFQGWQRVMKGKVDVSCVLFFECAEDVSTVHVHSYYSVTKNYVLFQTKSLLLPWWI